MSKLIIPTSIRTTQTMQSAKPKFKDTSEFAFNKFVIATIKNPPEIKAPDSSNDATPQVRRYNTIRDVAMMIQSNHHHLSFKESQRICSYIDLTTLKCKKTRHLCDNFLWMERIGEFGTDYEYLQKILNRPLSFLQMIELSKAIDISMTYWLNFWDHEEPAKPFVGPQCRYLANLRRKRVLKAKEIHAKDYTALLGLDPKTAEDHYRKAPCNFYKQLTELSAFGIDGRILFTPHPTDFDY